MTGGYEYFYTLQEICVLLNLLPNTFRQIAREYSDIVVPREQIRKGRPVMGLPRADFEVLRQIVELRSRGETPEEIRRVAGLAGAVVPSHSSVASGASPGDSEDAPPSEPSAAARLYGETLGGAQAVDEEVPLPAGGVQAERDPIPAQASEKHPPDEISEAEDGPSGVLTAGVDTAGSGVAEAKTEVAATGDPEASPPGRSWAGRSPSEPVLETALLAEMTALREELQKMDEHRREERDRLLTALMRTQHELQSLRFEVGVTLSRRQRKQKRGFWAWLLDL